MSKDTTVVDQELRYHLIGQYRDLIARRYDEVIANIHRTNVHITRDVALEIKDFFLDNIYPGPEQRRRLDAAFAELRNFTTNPALVWGLLGSLPMAIFQFGAHLPTAIRAGITSLQAYTSAITFEDAIVRTAMEKGFKEPVSDEQFFECLRALPTHSLETFIAETSSLFIVISNTTLLSKTIAIMKDVVARMKTKPSLYSADQVNAIQLGLDLMEQGFELLEPFTEDTKRDIVSFIAENERNFLTDIKGGNPAVKDSK